MSKSDKHNSRQMVEATDCRPRTAAAVAIVLFAGMLRLVALDSNPPGINQDEAERAYDAYCLRITGQDHYGARWPIFFRGFGNADYPPGTYTYLLIPFQALLGMNIVSTRLPAALLGTLNVWWLYLLVKRIYGERAGVFAAILLAVSPWQLHLSRIAFEVSLCPPLVTLGFLLLTSTASARFRVARFVLSGIAFSVALWTYNAFRVVVPLLLLGAVAIYAKQAWAFLRQPRGVGCAAGWAIGFIIGLTPFIKATIETPALAWARASATSFLMQDFSAATKVQKVLTNYLMHFSPDFLFVNGDVSPIHGMNGYGKLHYFYAPLLLLGLARVAWRWRSERFGLLLLWWIIIAPIPAAVTAIDSAHTLRATGVVPAYDILAAIGLDLLASVMEKRGSAVFRAAVAITTAIVVLNAGYFLYQYYVRYPRDAYAIFRAEWRDVLPNLREQANNCYAALLTPVNTNQLGMLYLFYSQLDPRQYFASRVGLLQGNEWDVIAHVDKVYFYPYAYIGEIGKDNPVDAKYLVVERPNVVVPGVERQRVFYPNDPNGDPALILYDIGTLAAPPTSPSAQ